MSKEFAVVDLNFSFLDFNFNPLALAVSYNVMKLASCSISFSPYRDSVPKATWVLRKVAPRQKYEVIFFLLRVILASDIVSHRI